MSLIYSCMSNLAFEFFFDPQVLLEKVLCPSKKICLLLLQKRIGSISKKEFVYPHTLYAHCGWGEVLFTWWTVMRWVFMSGPQCFSVTY